MIRQIRSKAKAHPKRVVFAEAEHYKILKAAEICKEEGFAYPILLGNAERIKSMIVENELIFWNVDEEIINIYKINLIQLDENIEPTNSQINVSEMILGTNIHQKKLELNNFVTFVRKNDLKYISLPSTSPANTGIEFDNIYKLWRQILAK
jgi:hypothetical protein